MKTRLLSFGVLAAVGALVFSPHLAQADVIYLDFLNPANGNQYNYSVPERQAIANRVAADYLPFGHTVTLTQPGSGDFVRVTINATTDFSGNSLAGGIANGIDFRNTNHADQARVNTGGLLTGADNTSANQVGLTATIAAHEAGHLMGLRHGDALGAIGNGFAPGSTLNEIDYNPDFPSGLPNNANETYTSIMASPASVDQFVVGEATEDTFFNERSSVKLAFANTGSVIAEQAALHGTIGTAQNIALSSLFVPNVLPEFVPGTATPTVNFGKVFDVSAVTVLGNIAAPGQFDFFSFNATAGDLFNFEVMSSVPSANGVNRYANSIDSMFDIFDSNGNLVSYYNGTATNDDEFESFDSILIDMIMPTTGSYFARVRAFDVADTGNYELFMYRFAANAPVVVPEANTALLSGLGLLSLAMVAFRRTRKRGANLSA